MRDERPRGQRLDLELDAIAWPEVSAPWVLDYLLEVGPVSAGGLGLSALSWSEIRAWSRLTRTPLTPDTARLLRHLSQVYVAALHASSDPAQPPYWACPEILDALQRQRQQRERGLGASLSALATRAANPG